MSKKDDEAAAYYADPAHRDSDGPGYALPDRPARLSSHVPIRFDRGTIAAIKQFADEDGLAVSAWVRHVVGREIKRRVSLRTHTGSKRNGGVMLSISQIEGPTTTSTTAAPFVTTLRVAG
jgi:hypothetical protein